MYTACLISLVAQLPVFVLSIAHGFAENVKLVEEKVETQYNMSLIHQCEFRLCALIAFIVLISPSDNL